MFKTNDKTIESINAISTLTGDNKVLRSTPEDAIEPVKLSFVESARGVVCSFFSSAKSDSKTNTAELALEGEQEPIADDLLRAATPQIGQRAIDDID